MMKAYNLYALRTVKSGYNFADRLRGGLGRIGRVLRSTYRQLPGYACSYHNGNAYSWCGEVTLSTCQRTTAARVYG